MRANSIIAAGSPPNYPGTAVSRQCVVLRYQTLAKAIRFSLENYYSHQAFFSGIEAGTLRFIRELLVIGCHCPP